jgi:Holliday junction resolvase-like predicted endonuclease
MLLLPPPLESTRRYLAFDESLRLDFVAVNETCKTVAIIDVTMPFENRYAAFQAVRQEKQKKYASLAKHYNRQGYNVLLDAFIVGALGGWDPVNERIINRLKLGHSYCRLTRKLMVSDAIRWSRDIYIEHLSEVRQYQEETGGGQ